MCKTILSTKSARLGPVKSGEETGTSISPDYVNRHDTTLAIHHRNNLNILL